MRRALLSGLLLILLFGPSGCAEDGRSGADRLSVVSLLGEGQTDGYALAEAGPVFEFPRDHGPHPDFRSEWWYFTGNLDGAAGRRFGFQLTLFRSALAPDERPGPSAWGTRQVWMGHLAVTDVAGGRFYRAEVFQRGALGLAGARSEPFRVWVGDWEAVSAGPRMFPLALVAGTGEFTLELDLEARKPLVLQGEQGYSRKGPEPGNASLYYAFTRLAAAGELVIGGEQIPVTGSAWLDREWSTSALGEGIAGWDWLSLQLDDGRDLMLYQLRLNDGAPSPFSAGSIVSPEGRVTRLGAGEFSMSPGRMWTSPETGATYPVAWKVRVPSASLDLHVEAALDAQEMNLSVRYWEGAVRAGGEGPRGRGYLELTGY
jgi:predicted secreted hydrolase